MMHDRHLSLVTRNGHIPLVQTLDGTWKCWKGEREHGRHRCTVSYPVLYRALYLYRAVYTVWPLYYTGHVLWITLSGDCYCRPYKRLRHYKGPTISQGHPQYLFPKKGDDVVLLWRNKDAHWRRLLPWPNSVCAVVLCTRCQAYRETIHCMGCNQQLHYW